MGIFDVKAERVETESNEARAMELEAQMFEAERSIVRQIWRENALKAKIAEAGRVGLRSMGESTCGFWGRSYGR